MKWKVPNTWHTHTHIRLKSAHILNAIIICRRLLLCEKRFGQAKTISHCILCASPLKELIGFCKCYCFFGCNGRNIFRNGIVNTCAKCKTLFLARWSLCTYLEWKMSAKATTTTAQPLCSSTYTENKNKK